MFDLVKINEKSLTVQYKNMLSEIGEYFPVMQKASKNFYKSQSQFMNNMFSIHPLTELRSLRQILAEVERTKMALEENYFKLRKQNVKIKKKQRELLETKDDLDRELIQIEIEKIESGLNNSQNYIEGAIRKIHAYVSQYQSILKKLGRDEFTEQDFEEDEARYHVMKAFEQGLCAARSHGGIIDEGNHIYLYQIGVSGITAQYEVHKLLAEEGKMLQQGEELKHELTVKWLEEMGEKYKRCPIKFATHKGMELISYDSLNRNTSV